MASKAELLGVYMIPVDEDLVRRQTGELYGEAPSAEQTAEVHEQLQSTVLVEVRVTDADDRFDVGDFVQEDRGIPRDNWQAAWAEAFLTLDGDRLLVKRWKSVPKDQRDFRIAFFIHFWKNGNTLLSSYGPLMSQATSPIPERLLRLVPYAPLD